MTENSIIHFVGFITQLHQEEFIDQWLKYARSFPPNPGDDTVTLQERLKPPGKYKYVSQHVFNEEEFHFSFMKKRDSDNFPDQKAKVIMMGGYTPTQIGNGRWNEDEDTKMLVFLPHSVNDISSYSDQLPGLSFNIYQPFYESCTYGYILEFFVPKTKAVELVPEIRGWKNNDDISMYHKCNVSLATSKRASSY
jgi:hypothetical protein